MIKHIQEKEIWKPIPEFENYKASSLGRVLNPSGELLKPYPRRRYQAVRLHNNGESHQIYLHRLIAKVFIPNPKNYRCVLHNNDVGIDNRVSNLRWGTMKMNFDDRFKNDKTLTAFGIKVPKLIYIHQNPLDYSRVFLGKYFNLTTKFIKEIQFTYFSPKLIGEFL